jgi:hypothetical protein
VVELFGDRYGENRPKNGMWRDHGLVEFFWHRRGGREPWVGEHFSVQAHRLRSGDPETVNRVIRERYGAFAEPVTFDEVSAVLTDRGVRLTEVPYPADPDEMRAFWQPAARTMAYVVAGSYYGRIGDLYRVVSPSAGTP